MVHRVDGTVHQGDHRAGGGRCAGPVDRTPESGRILRQQPARQRHGSQRHRDGHEEHRPPADRAREHSAGDHTCGSAQGGGSAPGPHRPGTLRGGEGRQQQGHGRRAEAGGTDPLHDAADDQHLLVDGPGREDRSCGEQGRSRDEDAASADEVRSPAREQQEPGEREHVGVHHPGQGRRTEVQLLLDRRQGNVHDGGVEHDEELRGHQEAERRTVPSRHRRRG